MVPEAELAVEITHHYDSADIDSGQFVPLIDTVRWRTQPQFHIPGRTPWCELAKPARFRNRPDVEYRAAKIKGVGLWNLVGYLHSGVQQDRRTDKAIRPTTSEYEPMARLRHFGLSHGGEFVDVPSAAPP